MNEQWNSRNVATNEIPFTNPADDWVGLTGPANYLKLQTVWHHSSNTADNFVRTIANCRVVLQCPTK